MTDPVSVDDSSVPRGQWARAEPQAGRWRLRNRKGGRFGYNAVLEILEDEELRGSITRDSFDGYDHRTYGFTPDRRSLISGGMLGFLSKYRLNGKKIGDFVGHQADVWSMSPSPDGRFLVSGSSDQTVRLWNLKTRELIVTLVHAPGKNGDVGDWVMWTPQGFYSGSPNAGRLVGWQLNNGPDKEADYVTGGQFRDTLNRTDIIEEAIRLASAKAAVARLEPGFNLAKFLSARPPSLTLVTPEPYAREFQGSANITAFVDEGSFAVDTYEVSVNGIKVPTTRGIVPTGHKRPPEGQIAEAFSVPLANRRNVISIKAINAAGESQVVRLPIQHSGEGPLDKRGKLYVVAVGVDNYKGLGNACGAKSNESCDLQYAGKDARLFTEAITKELGPRHANGIWQRLLTNRGRGTTTPRRQNILAALDGLAKADATDTVVLFLAGHGERGKDGKYYFLPSDIARKGGLDAVGSGRNIIEWTEIQKRLTRSKGRRMLFLDSCQSGALGAARAYNGRLLEDAKYEDFAAFMAAGPNQFAIERPDIGNGLFTHALTKGIAGGAFEQGQRLVRVPDLGTYISRSVFKLSRGLQRPVFTPHANFVLAVR